MSDDLTLVPCALCKATLANLFEGANQPSGGTEFVSQGHYGSGAFDPMDGSSLAINICDGCLKALAKARVVGLYPMRGKFKRWNGK